MKDEIRDLLERAIGELNEQLEEDEQLAFSPELRLIGKKAALDSMSLVALIAIIEDMVMDELDKRVELVSNQAFSQERSPFYSLGTLGSFMEGLLEEGEE